MPFTSTKHTTDFNTASLFDTASLSNRIRLAVLAGVIGLGLGCDRKDKPASPVTTDTASPSTAVVRKEAKPSTIPTTTPTTTPATNPTTAPAKSIAETLTEIEFTYRYKVGDKLCYRTITESWEGSAKSPLVMETLNVEEVVDISGGQTTWKSLESNEVKSTGDQETNPDSKERQNYKDKASLYTCSPDGQVLYDSGESTETIAKFLKGKFKVGQEWHGDTIEDGKKYSRQFKLAGIHRLNDQTVAVIDFESEEKQGLQTGRIWVTSDQHFLKMETILDLKDDKGNPARQTVKMVALKPDGVPVMP